MSDTKLAEIHAQEIRVSAPLSALRRRVTSQIPPISTDGGYARSREQQQGMGKVPSARSAKWAGLATRDAGAEMALLPEETQAMRKSKAAAEKALRAGTRALAYGSLLAAAGITGGAVLAASWFDIRSQADLRALMQRAAGPSVERIRLRLAPWKEWCRAMGGGSGGGGGGGARWVENSAVVQNLRRNFRVRRREEPAIEVAGSGSPPNRSLW